MIEKTENKREKATTAVEIGRENPAPAAGAGDGDKSWPLTAATIARMAAMKKVNPFMLIAIDDDFFSCLTWMKGRKSKEKRKFACLLLENWDDEWMMGMWRWVFIAPIGGRVGPTKIRLVRNESILMLFYLKSYYSILVSFDFLLIFRWIK